MGDQWTSYEFDHETQYFSYTIMHRIKVSPNYPMKHNRVEDADFFS